MSDKEMDVGLSLDVNTSYKIFFPPQEAAVLVPGSGY